MLYYVSYIDKNGLDQSVTIRANSEKEIRKTFKRGGKCKDYQHNEVDTKKAEIQSIELIDEV